MNEEKIIRAEAIEFYENSSFWDSYISSTEKLADLKSKLDDFYSAEHKAIFLDAIEKEMIRVLKEHRDKSHGGVATEECQYEINAEKLLFYLKQEIDTLPKIARQKFQLKENTKREKVFISYCHADVEYLKDVQRHFKPFLNHIDYWDDNKIKPGQKWKEEIKIAIQQTKVAILLVSTDFLGSEFIKNDELPPLLKAAELEGALILIVILKPCLFEEFTELNIYQAMNSPSFPVSKMNENEREELFVNLVRQTKKIINNSE